jgi:hypothetical protein
MSRVSGRCCPEPTTSKPERSSRPPRSHRFVKAPVEIPFATLPSGKADVERFVADLDGDFVEKLLDSGALENTLVMAMDGLTFWRQVLETHAGPTPKKQAPLEPEEAELLFEGIREAKELHGLLRKLGVGRPSGGRRAKPKIG